MNFPPIHAAVADASARSAATIAIIDDARNYETTNDGANFFIQKIWKRKKHEKMYFLEKIIII